MTVKNEFGEFVNHGKSYVITTPFTPRRLTNMITNQDGYLAEVSQWGTAYASFQFSNGEINTIVDKDNKTLYCRDEESGDVWCPGGYPAISKVDGYSCEHSDIYTKISSSYRDIRVTWTLFVPQRGAHEIWTVSIQNNSNNKRKISLVPAVRLSLTGFSAPRFFDEQLQYSVCDYEEKINGMYYQAGNPNPTNSKYNAVLASSLPIRSYCGDSEKFLGAPLDFSYPQILFTGEHLGNSKGMAGEPFQSIQNVIELDGQQTQVINYIFGIADSKQEGYKLVKQIQRPEQVESIFAGTAESIRKRREKLWIETPNAKLNHFVNIWLKKGLEFALRKKDATRDNLQFACGLIMADPLRVKQELLRVFSWQYQDGHALRSWIPLDTTYYCDGPLWYVLTTCNYIKFTDDIDFLNTELPYFDGGKGTVLEHLERGVKNVDENRGPHNMPLARFADWNDALTLRDENAESIFMAMGLGFMFKEMTQLMRYINEDEKALEYEEKHAQLKKEINAVAWDDEGKYYVRGFAYGEVIGGSSSRGSKIFVNPQVWSIMGDIVTEKRLDDVLNAIDQKIEMDLGCAVNLPAFSQFDPDFGRISAQLPGTWENGASYCHVTAFKAYADTLLKRADKALNSLLKIFPDHHLNPAVSSGATPFALTSSYCTNQNIWGKAGRPWLTGTQAWAMRTIVEGFLGIKSTYGGMYIDPIFPSCWNEASYTIVVGDAEYRVKIQRVGRDKTCVRLNNQIMQGGFIPPQKVGIYNIDVEL